MVDIQSPTAEIREGKKKRNKERKKKLQGKNIMACPIPYGAAITTVGNECKYRHS